MATLAKPQRAIQPLLQGARGYRKHLGQYGAGGRSSVNDKTVAVFGATGFLGRFVTNQLGRTGTRCFIPNRGCEMDVRRTKVQFDLGQVVFPFYSSSDEQSMRNAIGNADTVVNLIGKHYETKHLCFTRKEDGAINRVNSSFKNVNVDVAGMLARAAKAQGVKNFVHVSALAADPDSPSRWAQTKFAGELAVKEAFPEATIVRPAKLFGNNDRLLTWIALMATRMGRVPLVNDGDNLIQPIDARNVAQVLMAIIDDPENLDYRGKLVELAGPGEFSWREVADLVLDTTHRARVTDVEEMSMLFARGYGMLLEQLPNPLFTEDEALAMSVDVVQKPNPDALTLEDFNIADPFKMEECAISIVRRFRTVQHFGFVKGYH
ncbi:unnamed protein product [Ectocarpus sp. 6 AP-2014]